MSPGSRVVRHVLLDADGVVQQQRGGWLAAVEPFAGQVGEAFMQDAWRAEEPALRGQSDFLVDLPAVLERHGLEVSAGALYRAVWHSIEVDETSMALVEALRGSGYGVHLGTNQEHHRATYMRRDLDFDQRFDVSIYSCEIGLTKPDPAYFERAVAMIGAAPDEVLLVDDNAANVDSARAVGLRAVHWDLSQGHDLLLSHLAEHGVETHLG